MRTLPETILALVALMILGCGQPEADARPAEAAAGLNQAEERWEARTASGLTVRMRTVPAPPAAGPLRVLIHVDGPAPRAPLTVDLVSPSMPVHGVTRYALGPAGEAWAADIEIPMDGGWSVYVNFDDGSDAVELRFVAGDPASRTHPHPHTQEDLP